MDKPTQPLLSVDQVREVLLTADRRQWHAHGIGMLRTYIDSEQYGDRQWRLNLWHRSLINDGISTMHDHPWPFVSFIVAGEIRNMRYVRAFGNAPAAVEMMEGKITCGPGFNGMKPDPQRVRLLQQPIEIYRPGDRYEHRPDEIHDTYAVDGTITLIHRGEARPDCEASVFWPVGVPWGDATRPFDAAEARLVIDHALAMLDEENPVG